MRTSQPKWHPLERLRVLVHWARPPVHESLCVTELGRPHGKRDEWPLVKKRHPLGPWGHTKLMRPGFGLQLKMRLYKPTQ